MENLSNYITSIVKIEQEDLDLVLSKFEVKQLKKGDLILKRGQTASFYIYLDSGALRIFNDGADKPYTSWCFLPGDFFTEISSLHHRIPSRFNIEAIEPTELFIIDIADMEQLYERIPAWQEFGRKVWERTCISIIDQSIRFQTLSAEAMYLEFLKLPGFINKVPVNQLASILGITPNALSRIRKNIK